MNMSFRSRTNTSLVLVVACFMCLSCHFVLAEQARSGADENLSLAAGLYPPPQQISLDKGRFSFRGSKLYVDDTFRQDHEWLLEQLPGKGLKILPLDEGSGPEGIFVGNVRHPIIKAQIKNLHLKLPEEIDNEEGYLLAIRNDVVVVAGKDNLGIFYGVQTLKQLMAKKSRRLDAMTIFDWPDFSIRGLHLPHTTNLWAPKGTDYRTTPKKDWEKLLNGAEAGPEIPPGLYSIAQEEMRFDEDLARTLIEQMAEWKMNSLVLVLGDSIRWESHPEIAIEGAWSIERYKNFVAFIRKHHIQIMPELNLSTMHDTWLGKYGFEVDSPRYRQVVQDLIEETLEITGAPVEFFHLGWDEEDTEHYEWRHCEPLIVRPPVERWRSYAGFLDFLEKKNVEGVVWSDILCDRDDDFKWEWELLDAEHKLRKSMRRRSVFMDWWPYGMNSFDVTENLLKRDFRVIVASLALTNMELGKASGGSVRAKELKNKRILGMVQTVWCPIEDIAFWKDKYFRGIQEAAGPYWNAD